MANLTLVSRRLVYLPPSHIHFGTHNCLHTILLPRRSLLHITDGFDREQTLFGMNVDILDPPPPWWWYLPLAVGTMFLTVSIWIVFKRNETVRKALLHVFIPVL